MRWKNLRISFKLAIGFGSAALLTLAVGGWAVFGIGEIAEDGQQIVGSNKLRGEILQRELDHLKWVAQVSKFVYDEKATTLSVQLDPHQCGFGKWYYGPGREEAQALLPALKPLMASIESPHSELHKSAADILKLRSSGDNDGARRTFESVTDSRLTDLRAIFGESLKTVNAGLITDQHMVEGALKTKTALLILTLAGVVVGLGASLFISRSITKPISSEVEIASFIADGNLTTRIKLDQDDEVGQLARSMNRMSESLQTMIGTMNGSVAQLVSSSTQLGEVASELRRSAGESTSRSSSVAAAAEQMSANMTNVAAAMQQSSANVQLVATAASELAATIHEIAKRAADARLVTEGAVSTVAETSRSMDELAEAAAQIGKVTDAIGEISEQTKLLALNATIEAARAGDSGKGFAVVASEIKELARQVASATGDIHNRVEAIRLTTARTHKGIGGMGTVISEVNDTILTIATAVEEQSATVGDVARNCREVSAAVHEAARLVSETSIAASTVSSDISTLHAEAEVISSNTRHLNENSTQLGSVAQQLQAFAARFKV